MDSKIKKTIKGSENFEKNYAFIDKNQIISALYKKSLGYEVEEVVEEYSYDEYLNEKLVKKKTTKKDIPPDMTAIKILFELYFKDSSLDIKNLTDEELKQKINEIIEKLKGENEDDFDS